MNRLIAHAVVGVLLLAPIRAVVAGETGMSHDDTVNPGAPAPHIAPPGGSTGPRPLSTNTTPRTGATPPQSGLPPREVQPGEETPQADAAHNLGGASGIIRRKPTGRTSGDEDDLDDQEIERRTVQGMEKPGTPSKGSSQARQSGGGDGTQTEDELYVGDKRRDTGLPGATPGPGGAARPKVDPKHATGAKAGPAEMTRETPRAPVTGMPATPMGGTGTAKGPNCGTHWTNWTDDPQTNVNPCPPGCTRGERQLVKTHKQGDTILYDARYQCYGTALRAPPKPKPMEKAMR